MNIFFWEFLIQLSFALGSYLLIIPYPIMWPFLTFVGTCWVYMSSKKLRKGIRCVRQCKARELKKERENGIQ